jgi:hypothetical protein
MDEIITYKMCAVKVRNAKLRNYLKSRLFYLYNNCDISFLTMFSPPVFTHPVNFSCGRKPERPKKTTFGRALTDFFHMSP